MIVMVAPRHAAERRAYLRNAQEGGREATARATIHVFSVTPNREPAKKSWMVGTRPTMTVE
jgi:hypothetical protein